MHTTLQGRRGIAVAPHALAAESAVAVLRDGGNALEAMIAAAATIAVVYPHMNSIGGDGFWVIHRPGHAPGGIDASGRSAAAASRAWYHERGITERIPFRGGIAALTVAGAISGWGAAQSLSRRSLGGRLPLSRLLADAIWLARQGAPVSVGLARTIAGKRDELQGIAGFAGQFLPDGQVPQPGSLFHQPRLASTLEQIARRGPDDFYRGELARAFAAELQQVGSPLALSDLQSHHAQLVDPLSLAHSQARLHNMVPPSQGLVSLLILGLMDRFQGWQQGPESAAFIHAQVEATKLAFRVRDRHLTDRDAMRVPAAELLSPRAIDTLARDFRSDRALPWPEPTDPSDTVWMGVIDGSGLAVSFIQSIYHEFGSGVVLPSSGVNWQNRGCSFSLDARHINTLEPGKKPFHTLNPALALRPDGSTMVYGTMGGDGQPQTQATLFHRVTVFGDSPQQAISRPRWLLGRTWGHANDSLKLEGRFDPAVFDALRAMGHEVERISDWDDGVGHAGMLLRQPNGVLQGGFDPRSDGSVVVY